MDGDDDRVEDDEIDDAFTAFVCGDDEGETGKHNASWTEVGAPTGASLAWQTEWQRAAREEVRGF